MKESEALQRHVFRVAFSETLTLDLLGLVSVLGLDADVCGFRKSHLYRIKDFSKMENRASIVIHSSR
jgi:hypothetical protein